MRTPRSRSSSAETQCSASQHAELLRVLQKIETSRQSQQQGIAHLQTVVRLLSEGMDEYDTRRDSAESSSGRDRPTYADTVRDGDGAPTPQRRTLGRSQSHSAWVRFVVSAQGHERRASNQSGSSRAMQANQDFRLRTAAFH